MVNLKHAGRRAAARLMSWRGLRRSLKAASRAGLLPPQIWRRLPVEDTFDATLRDGSVRFRYCSVQRDGIGRRLYWRGIEGFEWETASFFLTLVRTASRFVDVGANTGFYTLLACAANPSIAVTSYEPVERVFERLSLNVRINDFSNRCTLRRVAVASSAGRSKFHVPDGDLPVSGSLDLAGFHGLAGQLVEVEVVSLDGECGQDPPVDLVKIDVENFEHEVVAGMQGLLKTHRPALILECLPNGSHEDVQEILDPHGYIFFRLTQRGPVREARLRPDEYAHNFACMPRERARGLGLASS